MPAALLLVLLTTLSACSYTTREEYYKGAVSIASHELYCPPEQITLNSVREETDPFTLRLRAITYEATGCGSSKLYRADDEDMMNVVTVKELK